MSKSIMRWVAILMILLASDILFFAQSPAPQERRSVGKELDVWVSKTEEHLVAAADAMPEQKYGFAPKAGEFSGVRTFGEQVKHVSAANYILGSAALGQKPPNGEHGESAPDFLKSKADIVKYLRDSFAYLHRAAAVVNDNNETETIKALTAEPVPD